MTAILTNMLELAAVLRDRVCTGRAVCERTGLPHATWAPEVVGGEVVSYPTEQEAEYPAGLCEVVANGIFDWAEARSIEVEDHAFLFTEVFSGPRAPLTQAVVAVGRDRRWAGRRFE